MIFNSEGFNLLRSIPDYQRANQEWQIKKREAEAITQLKEAQARAKDKYPFAEHTPAAILTAHELQKLRQGGTPEDIINYNELMGVLRSGAYGLNSYAGLLNTPGPGMYNNLYGNMPYNPPMTQGNGNGGTPNVPTSNTGNTGSPITTKQIYDSSNIPPVLTNNTTSNTQGDNSTFFNENNQNQNPPFTNPNETKPKLGLNNYTSNNYFASDKGGMSPIQNPQRDWSIAGQTAYKAGLTKEAEKDAEYRKKLQYEGDIAADTKTKELKAKYMREGYESLPKNADILKTLQISEYFLQPKIDSIVNRAENLWNVTGFTGDLLSAQPGTDAFNLKADLTTLLAAATFDKLQEIKRQSPNGSALGSVSDTEGQLLQTSMQNLLNSQSAEQFVHNLRDFQKQRLLLFQKLKAAYAEDYQRFNGAQDPYLSTPDQIANNPQGQKVNQYANQYANPEENIPTGGNINPPKKLTQKEKANVEFNLKKGGATQQEINEYFKAIGAD